MSASEALFMGAPVAHIAQHDERKRMARKVEENREAKRNLLRLRYGR